MTTKDDRSEVVARRDEIVAAMRKCADDLWALAKEMPVEESNRDARVALKGQSSNLHARCVELEHLELP
jgi:hypothetical protein